MYSNQFMKYLMNYQKEDCETKEKVAEIKLSGGRRLSFDKKFASVRVKVEK